MKEIRTKFELHPLLKKRWSPRSFSKKLIANELIEELFEAASVAASANNEQPWKYVHAVRESEGFETLWNCLLPGNQPWTKHAAVLIVALQRNTFRGKEKPNPWAMHDVGMANANLLLQAAHRDIYGHLMAGFDPEKIRQSLNLPDDETPVCMGALGYLDTAEKLDEPYRSRETADRTRNAVDSFVVRL